MKEESPSIYGDNPLLLDYISTAHRDIDEARKAGVNRCVVVVKFYDPPLLEKFLSIMSNEGYSAILHSLLKEMTYVMFSWDNDESATHDDYEEEEETASLLALVKSKKLITPRKQVKEALFLDYVREVTDVIEKQPHARMIELKISRANSDLIEPIATAFVKEGYFVLQSNHTEEGEEASIIISW